MRPPLRRLALLAALSGTIAVPAGAQGRASPGEGAAADDPFRRTDALTWVAVGMAALHHTDHVLRGNHSGWPFTGDVGVFTYSLAIYPVVGAAYALDAGPLAFTVIDAAGTAGLLLAHTLIEPPSHQYEPWADGSNELGIESPAAGRISQAISVGLSLAVAAHLASSVMDGREHGFTWRRSGSRGAGEGRVVVRAPTPTAAGGWAWSADLRW